MFWPSARRRATWPFGSSKFTRERDPASRTARPPARLQRRRTPGRVAPRLDVAEDAPVPADVQRHARQQLVLEAEVVLPVVLALQVGVGAASRVWRGRPRGTRSCCSAGRPRGPARCRRSSCSGRSRVTRPGRPGRPQWRSRRAGCPRRRSGGSPGSARSRTSRGGHYVRDTASSARRGRWRTAACTCSSRTSAPSARRRTDRTSR